MQSRSSIEEMDVVLKEIERSFGMLVNNKEEKRNEGPFEVDKEKPYEEQMKSGEEKIREIEEKLKTRKENIEKGEQIINNMKDFIDKMNLFISVEKTEGKELKSQYNETIDKIKIVEENNLQNLITPLQKQVTTLQLDLKTKKEKWDVKKNSFDTFDEQDKPRVFPFQFSPEKLQFPSALANQINQKSQPKTDIWGRPIGENTNSPQKIQEGTDTSSAWANSLINIANTLTTQKEVGVGVENQRKVQTGSPQKQKGTSQPKDSTNSNITQQQFDASSTIQSIFKEVPSLSFNPSHLN